MLNNTVVLLGVLTAYAVTSGLIHAGIFRQLIYDLLPMTYLLFLSHNMILQTIRKGAYLVIRPESDILHLSIYFGAPILTAASVYLVYIAMKKTMPNVLALLTGGRIVSRKYYSYS